MQYEDRLRSGNIVDYDDMLTLAVTLLSHSDKTRLKYSRYWRHIQVAFMPSVIDAIASVLK